MDARAFQRLVKGACDDGRAGDILFLALRTDAVPVEALYFAARCLRDLMAYPAVIEVCDRLLALDAKHYMALELRALCRARLRDGEAGRYSAAQDLDRAIQLAQGQGEAPALVGRLFKQAWVESWLRADDPPDAETVGRNRLAALSAIDRLILSIDAYEAAYVRTRKRDLYPAINALTLAAIAIDLLGPDHQRTVELRAVATRHLADVAKRVNASVAMARTDEDRYWALATKAEWYAVVDTAAPGAPTAAWLTDRGDTDPDRARERDEKRTELLRTTLAGAVSVAKQRLFWIDSTLQQFRMLRALGIRPGVVRAALDVLEHAWRVAIHPDAPATRIAFLHVSEQGQARRFDPSWLRATFDSVIEKTVEAHGDCIAYLSGGRADILFANACRRRGVPYCLHLPSAPRPTTADASGDRNADWQRAFERLIAGATPHGRRRGAMSPIQLMDRNLGITEAAGAKMPRGSLQCWLLDSARAYGSSKVVVVGLDGFDKEDLIARAVEGVRLAGGSVERIEAPKPQSAPGSHWDTMPLPDSLREDRAPTAAPEPEPSLPSPLPSGPYWLRDLFTLLTTHADTKTQQRWKAYGRNPLAWSLLSSLQLRFEPVEQLMPQATAKTTTGFEVMGMTPKREPYGELLKQARAANVDAVDLDLTILAYGLLTVRLLREHLRNQIGGRATWPIFTLNVNEAMLRAPAIEEILDHYFDRSLNSRIVFELSETFPEGLHGIGKVAQRHGQIKQAIALLHKLASLHGFLFVLDDSGRIDPGLRPALQALAHGTKADALYVADVFGLADPSTDVIEELKRYRVGSKPYVLEGIEQREIYDYIRSNWTGDEGPVGLQGYFVKVHEPFAPFFEPLSDNPEQPRGFRLTAATIARVGPR
jgi:hypothetical protein